MTDHRKRAVTALHKEQMIGAIAGTLFKKDQTCEEIEDIYSRYLREMDKRLDSLIEATKEEAQKAMLDDLLLSGALIEIDQSDGKKTVSITADTVGAGKKIWRSAYFREITGEKDDV